MIRIVSLLAFVKVACVSLDPEHDLFRPISLYQTSEYGYLGTVFVALTAFASTLVLRKLFLRPDADRLIIAVLGLFALTLGLWLLIFADVRFGAFHLLIAVTALSGYAVYLLYAGRLFGDVPLQIIAAAMLFLCGLPIIRPSTFGVIENVLVALHCVAFTYFYHVTLEVGRPTSRVPRPLP